MATIIPPGPRSTGGDNGGTQRPRAASRLGGQQEQEDLLRVEAPRRSQTSPYGSSRAARSHQLSKRFTLQFLAAPGGHPGTKLTKLRGAGRPARMGAGRLTGPSGPRLFCPICSQNVQLSKRFLFLIWVPRPGTPWSKLTSCHDSTRARP